MWLPSGVYSNNIDRKLSPPRVSKWCFAGPAVVKTTSSRSVFLKVPTTNNTRKNVNL